MSHHYLEFHQVDYRYESGKHALKNVSFLLDQGEKVALLGANGAGKTTLLQLACGVCMPAEGSIDVGGITLSRDTLVQVRQRVGVLFQNADEQLFMPTVWENVTFGPLNMGLPLPEVEQRSCEALLQVEAWNERDALVSQLSWGMKRRVALASVLSMHPQMLLMDEPTEGLDPLSRIRLVKMLRTFPHICLMATHDLSTARHLCQRALVLRDGALWADGTVHQVMDNEELMRQAHLAE